MILNMKSPIYTSFDHFFFLNKMIIPQYLYFHLFFLCFNRCLIVTCGYRRLDAAFIYRHCSETFIFLFFLLR